MNSERTARLVLPTVLALTAFAANSLLCRKALGEELIDPVTFTTLRLAGGAAALLVVGAIRRAPGPSAKREGSWLSALALFAYAIAFSLAYVWLDAGTGALLLFGAVQATMIGAGLVSGERPRAAEWLGLAAALGGLVFLVFPGITAPDPAGAALMAVSGVAWGAYSLRGRHSRSPVGATTGNFLRATPMALLVSAIVFSSARAGTSGVALALISGSLTTGIGYVLWYAALRGLAATRAAIVQLIVPVLTAFGGVAFLSERITARLVLASVLILGGVAVAVNARGRRAGNDEEPSNQR